MLIRNVGGPGGVWVADSSFEERMVLKAAGWWWHGGDCRASCKACIFNVPLKVWWTPDRVKAARLVQYADQDTKAGLEEVKVSQIASRATDADIQIPAPLGQSYLPFQNAGIAYCQIHERVLIGDEMGLGKTIQALGAINSDDSVASVLVICPATLRANWAREAAKWLVRPMRTRVIEERELPEANDQLVIVNYDKLVGARGKALHAALMARKWDMLIVDESHYLKIDSSQRTVAILGREKKGEKIEGLISRARRVLCLTGTPILNRPREVWTMAHALAPGEFRNFFSFAKRYCGAHHNGWGWDFDGAANLPELQEKLRSLCMVRRLKSEVLKELPAKRRQVICLPRNGAAKAVQHEEEEWKMHEEELTRLQDEVDLAHAAGDEDAYKTAVSALRKGYRVAFEAISRVRHDTAVAKIPAVIEHVDDILEQLPKVVLFAHHHDVVDALEKHYGAACVVLTGETPMADRQGLVDRFQTDPSCKLFIGSITAAGVGITLTAASHVVFAELTWTPGELSQAEDRCHRIGQQESVNVQHLVFDGSLDARMAQLLVEKQEIAEKMLDAAYEIDLPVVPVAGRGARPPRYPAVPAEQKAAALLYLRTLAGVCDGARAKDDVGFNGSDARIGHALAACTQLTDGQYWLARRILPKYHGQLGWAAIEAIGFRREEKE
jgi:SWI/SNF-related matrix-associated actin-dependent regulator 1 of chromatin subfamily A